MSTNNSSLRLVSERGIPALPPPKQQRTNLRSRFKLPKPDLAATLGYLKGSAMILNVRALERNPFRCERNRRWRSRRRIRQV